MGDIMPEKTLIKLLIFGLKAGYFKIKELHKIEKTCPSKLPVIDFDEAKKEICKKHNLNEYSSCDALLIIARQKRLEFMEIKTFEKLLSLLDKKYGDFERKKNKIIKKIDDFNLYGDIYDSIQLLQILLHSNYNFRKDENHNFGNEIYEEWQFKKDDFNLYGDIYDSIQLLQILLHSNYNFRKDENHNFGNEIYEEWQFKKDDFINYQQNIEIYFKVAVDIDFDEDSVDSILKSLYILDTNITKSKNDANIIEVIKKHIMNHLDNSKEQLPIKDVKLLPFNKIDEYYQKLYRWDCIK